MQKRKYCERCKRPVKVCLCQQITVRDNQWPVVIFQHYKENKHPLNTANIAKLSLKQCQIILSNDVNYNSKQTQYLNSNSLLVYPGKECTPIEEMTFEKPQTLLFLDGTWRKTRKLLYESPKLDKLKKICISPTQLSRYLIRKTPNSESLSTLEAIVYVLSLVEKEPKLYQSLLITMDHMINKQIELMGEVTFNKNYLNKTDSH